jgi:uncharacterized membrane protein
MNDARDETQQRLIHRLEAFSDIIIGFSLAQLALSLAIPKNGAEGLLQHSEPLVAFIITFALVCGMWWAHHKLFVHYFVPIPVMVVLNFITLAGVSFAVYSVQLMLHGGAAPLPGKAAVSGHSSMDFVFYLSSLALVYGLLGIQYFYGWSVRREHLPDKVAYDGLRSALMLIGVALASGVIAALTLRYGLRTASLQYFGYAVLAFAITLRLLFRYLANQHVVPKSPTA